MLDKDEVKSSEEIVENIENKEEATEKVVENIEKKEESKEVVKNTEKSDELPEEINDKFEEITVKNHNEIKKEKVGFLQFFKEGIKNTLGIFVVSLGSLVVLGLILRYILGFNIKDIWGMLFIVYLIVSLFYPYIKAKFYRKNK